jgi:hypothetical protein
MKLNRLNGQFKISLRNKSNHYYSLKFRKLSKKNKILKLLLTSGMIHLLCILRNMNMLLSSSLLLHKSKLKNKHLLGVMTILKTPFKIWDLMKKMNLLFTNQLWTNHHGSKNYPNQVLSKKNAIKSKRMTWRLTIGTFERINYIF